MLLYYIYQQVIVEYENSEQYLRRSVLFSSSLTVAEHRHMHYFFISGAFRILRRVMKWDYEYVTITEINQCWYLGNFRANAATYSLLISERAVRWSWGLSSRGEVAALSRDLKLCDTVTRAQDGAVENAPGVCPAVFSMECSAGAVPSVGFQ